MPSTPHLPDLVSFGAPAVAEDEYCKDKKPNPVLANTIQVGMNRKNSVKITVQ